MAQFSGFCLAFAAGWAGFFLFRFLRVPNPALLGSMAATGTLNVAGWYPEFTTWPVSFAATALIGIMLGRQIDRNVLRRARLLIRPMLTQAGGILVLSMICGFTMHLMAGAVGSDISLATSLICASGGGMTEMIVFGISVHADVAVIAFAQLFRIIVFLAIIPRLSMIAEKLAGRRAPVKIGRSADSLILKFARRDYVALVCCALAGASLGRWLQIPAGSMLGAMFFCGLLVLCLNKKYLYNPKLRLIAQIGLGLVMGERMNQDVLSHLGILFLPILATSAVMLAGCALLTLLMYKTTDWDLTTCLLCSAPAGLSQIAVYAEEIGADSFTASVFHTVRIIGIVTIYPWLIMPFL